MSTNTLLRDNGELRHGHPSLGSPTHAQWHEANTFHRNDPDAHERENSWGSPGWSGQNYDLGHEYKRTLIEWAREQHDEAKRYHDRGWGRYSPSPMPRKDEVTTTPREYNSTQEADEIERRVREMESNLPKPSVSGMTATDMPNEELNEALSSTLSDDEPTHPVWPTSGTILHAIEKAAAAEAEAEPEPSPSYEIIEANDEEPQDGTLGERVSLLEEYVLEAGPKVDELEERVATVQKDNDTNYENLTKELDKLTQDYLVVERKVDELDSRQPTVTLDVLTQALDPFAQRIGVLESAQSRKIEYWVHNGEKVTVTEGLRHEAFERLLMLVLSLDPHDRNVWIAGPAGSGKTQLAHQLAEALELEFEFQGALDSPYKVSGYKDANGNYHDTAFRRKYEKGGIILFDEVDFSNPAALSEINAATSNGWASFPDGMVPRHENCIVMCAANTWGMGGDSVYIGTAKQNAASLDRFITLEVNYDEELERLISLDQEWTRIVQACRKAAFDAGAQIVISPRASIKGGQMLSRGLSRDLVFEALFGKHKKLTSYATIFRRALDWVALEVSASSSNGSASVGSVHRPINAVRFPSGR